MIRTKNLNRLLRHFVLGYILISQITSSGCYGGLARQESSQLSQNNLNELGSLEHFLDTHDELGQQIVKQTVKLEVWGPESAKEFFKGSAFVINNKSIVTSSHTFAHLFVEDDGELKLRHKTGSIRIINPEGRVILRADVSFEDFLKNMDPKLGISAALDWNTVASSQIRQALSQDVAILNLKIGSLERALGFPIWTFRPDPNPPSIGAKLYSFGYSAGESVWALHATPFLADQDFGFFSFDEHNSLYLRKLSPSSIRNASGDSGGPLFTIRQSSGEFSLVGLVTAMYSPSDGGRPRELYTSFRHPNVERLMAINAIEMVPLDSCNPSNY